MKTLRLILGDQLNINHSWFAKIQDDVVYLQIEMHQEMYYVKHHIQKVVGFFLAMRNFSQELVKQGHQVIYVTLEDKKSKLTLPEILDHYITQQGFEKFEYQLPDEYRLDKQLVDFSKNLSIPYQVFDTEHFFTSREELAVFFKGNKRFLMESFYRMMRKKTSILMHGDIPEGNQWNFDHENRKPYKGEVEVPQEITFKKNVSEIVSMLHNLSIPTFGKIVEEKFNWPVTRAEAIQQLDYFCNNLLEYFGTYEDAMHEKEKYLFHSRLSFALNIKLLSPNEVLEQVISYYYQNQNKITLAQVEGFVRQILGWREYIRGMYWKFMPEYATYNKLEMKNKLPNFYWTGETKMNCLKTAINQSLEDAYAHHILRLMIIGNFSLLVQIHPDEVDAWYLGVYIDAIEWVEMPNTRGMSQYADGGLIATKPYISSGSYINKMSNYCKNCVYNVKERIGEKSCPFNSLYWNFLDEKKADFKNNQRMSMMLNLLNKISPEELFEIKKRATLIIQKPDDY